MDLLLPEGGAAFDAAVFTQTGEFVMAGHREECERRAMEIGGLYCWIDPRSGRPVVRADFSEE